MDIAEALLLGVVQGLTEWLPVSSSGHLVIAQELLGLSAEKHLLFDLMVHLGTVLAVCVYFRRELLGIVKAMLSTRGHGDRDEKLRMLGFMILLGTIPIAVVGLTLSENIEEAFTVRMVGIALIVNAIVLVVAERMASAGAKRAIRPVDALIVGLFQAAAIIPGISRSGFSISGGLFRGIEREVAATFAFLLSAPSLLGAFAYGAITLDAHDTDFGMMMIGLVSAFAVGIVAIDFLLKAIRAGKLWIFGVYCLALGALALAMTL
ncbi:MAG: undecaprenyl-diphosphate phosphatase [Methanobacteriota archaeon]|nr:MAG: undecaprenyl-diphosphate phosphatase [Euryarchaeota archaeon]